MNTKINYFYRDASNYKAVPEADIIVAGELAESDIVPHTHSDQRFIPHDIGLPELQTQLEGYPGVDDHIWHELIGLEPTDQEPTVEKTAQKIKNRLENIAENDWDESSAFERHKEIFGVWG